MVVYGLFGLLTNVGLDLQYVIPWILAGRATCYTSLTSGPSDVVQQVYDLLVCTWIYFLTKGFDAMVAETKNCRQME